MPFLFLYGIPSNLFHSIKTLVHYIVAVWCGIIWPSPWSRVGTNLFAAIIPRGFLQFFSLRHIYIGHSAFSFCSVHVLAAYISLNAPFMTANRYREHILQYIGPLAYAV